MPKKIADILAEALRDKKPAPKKRAARKPAKKKAAAKKRSRKPPPAGEPNRIPVTIEAGHELIERFAEAYVQTGFNGRAAMLKLKPDLKVKGATVQAHRLKNTPGFTEALYRAMARVRQKLEADTNEILRGWEYQSRANVMDYMECVEDPDVGFVLRLKNLDELPVEVQRNIKKVKVTSTRNETTTKDGLTTTTHQQHVELALVDAQGALNSLARSAGMFKDNELEELGKSVADLLRKRLAALPAPVGKRLPVTFDEHGNIVG